MAGLAPAIHAFRRSQSFNIHCDVFGVDARDTRGQESRTLKS
jgi:hypothetical protein